MKKKKKLRLYVWEGALESWTVGVMFALAASPEAARKAILKKDPRVRDTEFKPKPRRVTKTEGFATWGGD